MVHAIGRLGITEHRDGFRSRRLRCRNGVVTAQMDHCAGKIGERGGGEGLFEVTLAIESGVLGAEHICSGQRKFINSDR